MKKKRYPPQMLLVGLFMSLSRTFYIPGVALVLLLLHFVLPQSIPALAALLIFLLWPVYAVIDQLVVRHKIMSGDEYDFMTDPEKADTWMEDLRRQAKAQIDAALGPLDQDGHTDGRETDDQDDETPRHDV